MMADENKPTTPKQKALITLIIIVSGLLFVSLSMSGSSGSPTGADSGVDRSECLNRGDVWDESNQVCLDSAAGKYPQKYTATCSSSDVLQFVALDKNNAQLVLPGAPPTAYRIRREDTDVTGDVYRDTNEDITVDRSEGRLSIHRTDSTLYDRCRLRRNGTTAGGTSTVTLGVGQTGRAGAVTITLNSIVADDRCPVNAVCVTSGDTVIGTTLRTNNLQEQPNLSSAGSAYSFAGRSVVLADVLPLPFANHELQTDQYRVQFMVTN
jgi:hypothetical protein